ncbi:MAG TPA: indolepyruvate oxidoreductase, partial [Bacteroidetes bacterium]|nr:indolepyruvate oxidoreductase [Bacteroidota bacterium]
NPFKNIPDYPPMEEVLAEIKKLPRYIIVDADKLAQAQGSVKAANIVVLGAASPFLGLKYGSLEKAVRQLFGKKGGDIVELNLKALEAGRRFAEENRME